MRGHDVSGATETIEAAPAKINLALHVTGQRADGYHLLETLVTFTEAGDTIRIRNADADSFSISGPFGDLLRAGDGGDNLVTRARDLLRDALRTAPAQGLSTQALYDRVLAGFGVETCKPYVNCPHYATPHAEYKHVTRLALWDGQRRGLFQRAGRGAWKLP